MVASLRAVRTSVTEVRGSHHQVGSPPARRWGSKSHTGPRASAPRSPRVASTMSRLLEVTTTAPGAANTAGIAVEVVLPVRVPAMWKTWSSQVARSSSLPWGSTRPMGSPGAGCRWAGGRDDQGGGHGAEGDRKEGGGSGPGEAAGRHVGGEDERV